ncbi:MAG: hypothetical protein HYR55_09220 [Acidobacteria bacterium]|nr:hypothetical protein [Acidobacteriota bacterium]MBI3656663.1 hypothetical protein [Acidobacteriota bacterium]
MIPYSDHHAARRLSLRRIPFSGLLLGLLAATLTGAPSDYPAYGDPRVAFHAGRWNAAIAGRQAAIARDPTAILTS